MILTRKRITILAAALALVAAGVALAAWLTSGNGPAGGQAAELQALTVTADPSSAPTLLFPGGSGDAAVSVTNPGNVALTVTQFRAPFALPVSSPDSTCDSSVTWNGALYPTNNVATLASPVPLAAGATVTVTIPNALKMAASAPDACQGATFETGPIQVTASTN